MDDKETRTDRNLEFVARHYRADAFDVNAGWRSVRSRLWQDSVSRPWFVGRRAAAAIAACVALAASACILTWKLTTYPDRQPDVTTTEVTAGSNGQVVAEVKRIEFADAPLPEVVQAIERTYGVKVTNLPVEEYRLTLSYEGTASDLIATINDLLGIGLKIDE